MSKKIVVFGSIVQDLVSYTDHFPRPGESVRGNAFLTGGGGKGANQSVAAALLGADVTFLGRVGDDLFGEANLTGLRKAGVNVDHVEKSTSSPTATATITVNKEGENTIVVTLGANLELTAEVADRTEAVIAEAGMLLCQAEIPQEGNRRAFELARKHGVRTFFNPAPGDRGLDNSLLSLVDIICTNENEVELAGQAPWPGPATISQSFNHFSFKAEFITNIAASSIDEAKKAAKRMLEMGPSCAIVTLGGQGAVVVTKEQSIHVPGVPVEVVDTTGAGDCFCGTFCALLMAGKSAAEAVEAAVAVSGLSVQRKGTQISYWSEEEIRRKHPEIQL